jgi:hypothetical protein
METSSARPSSSEMYPQHLSNELTFDLEDERGAYHIHQ